MFALGLCAHPAQPLPSTAVATSAVAVHPETARLTVVSRAYVSWGLLGVEARFFGNARSSAETTPSDKPSRVLVFTTVNSSLFSIGPADGARQHFFRVSIDVLFFICCDERGSSGMLSFTRVVG